MKWIFTSIIWALVIAVVLLSYRISLNSVTYLLWSVFSLLVAILVYFCYLSRNEQKISLHQKERKELQDKYNLLMTQYNTDTQILKQRVGTLEKNNAEFQNWKASIENRKKEVDKMP